MHRREAIEIQIDGQARYVAAKLEPDGAWYTADINRAKVWRHPGMAAQWMFQHSGVTGRIVDPRGVAGYVDKPSAAARRHAGRRS